MLEAILILSIIMAIRLMPIRNKSYEQLDASKKALVDKNFAAYKRSKKGQQTPNMTVQEYMPIIQKLAKTYLILAICLLPLYILAVCYIYMG